MNKNEYTRTYSGFSSSPEVSKETVGENNSIVFVYFLRTAVNIFLESFMYFHKGNIRKGGIYL